MASTTEDIAAAPGRGVGWKAHLVGDFTWGRLVRFVAVLYASLAAYGWFASEAKIFLPHAPGYRLQAPYFALSAPDGTPIAARWLESPGARHTLLYSHGNAEDLNDLAPVLEAYRAMGFSVLAYDYRGYGASGGNPSERGAYEDLEVAYRHLVDTRRVPADRIIAFGHSLGGGPTAALASRLPVAGVVLESTFVSAIRVLTNVKLLPFDRFDTIARLPAIDRPVLVIHGRQDDTIPFWHGEALFAAARSPKQHLWLDGAGHDDVVESGAEPYRRALQAFAASLAK